MRASSEAAMPREEARSDRECVGNVRERPVHRTLDLADHPPAVVGDEEARRIDQIQRESGHDSNLFPVCKEKPFPGVRVVLTGLAGHDEHRNKERREVDAGDGGDG